MRRRWRQDGRGRRRRRRRRRRKDWPAAVAEAGAAVVACMRRAVAKRRLCGVVLTAERAAAFGLAVVARFGKWSEAAQSRERLDYWQLSENAERDRANLRRHAARLPFLSEWVGGWVGWGGEGREGATSPAASHRAPRGATARCRALRESDRPYVSPRRLPATGSSRGVKNRPWELLAPKGSNPPRKLPGGFQNSKITPLRTDPPPLRTARPERPPAPRPIRLFLQSP